MRFSPVCQGPGAAGAGKILRGGLVQNIKKKINKKVAKGEHTQGGTLGAEVSWYRISACESRDQKDDRKQQRPDQCRPAKDKSEVEDSVTIRDMVASRYWRLSQRWGKV